MSQLYCIGITIGVTCTTEPIKIYEWISYFALHSLSENSPLQSVQSQIRSVVQDLSNLKIGDFFRPNLVLSPFFGPHLLSKWGGVSCSCLQNLHDASSIRLRFIERFLSRQCLVRKPVNRFSLRGPTSLPLVLWSALVFLSPSRVYIPWLSFTILVST